MSRGTPTTPFRIPPALKERARRVAVARGETLTAVVVRALEQYVAAGEKQSLAAAHEPAGN